MKGKYNNIYTGKGKVLFMDLCSMNTSIKKLLQYMKEKYNNIEIG